MTYSILICMAYKDKNKKRETLKRYWKQRIFKRLAKRLKTKGGWHLKIRDIDLFSIAKKQKLICPLTGRKLTQENISVDHIKPKSQGGSLELDNLRLTVKEANLGKFLSTDEEFISLCYDVVKHNPRPQA